MTKIYIQKTWHGLILSIFFTKFWGLFDSYWGWVFTDAFKKKNFHFRKPQHFLLGWTTYQFFSYVKKKLDIFRTKIFGNLVVYGAGRFLSFRFLKQDRGARTIRTQTTTVLVEMLDDWGGFFFWFLLWILLVITWKNANDSVVFSQKKKLDCANCTNVQSRKVLACNLKKKHPQHNLWVFFFEKKTSACKCSILPPLSFNEQKHPSQVRPNPKKTQISGSWDKLDTPLPCIAWIWFNSSGLTQASWAPNRGSEFCLGWPEIHWNPRNQLSFWQFFLIFREFLMRIKRWFVLKKQKLLWKRKKSAKRCDTQINEMRQE